MEYVNLRQVTVVTFLTNLLDAWSVEEKRTSWKLFKYLKIGWDFRFGEVLDCVVDQN